MGESKGSQYDRHTELFWEKQTVQGCVVLVPNLYTAGGTRELPLQVVVQLTHLVSECHLFCLLCPGEDEVKLMNYSLLEHSHKYMPSLLPVLLQSLNLLYTVGLPWFHNCMKEKVYHNVCKHVCMAGNNLPYNKLGNCTNNAQSRGSFRKIVKRGQKRGARFCQGDVNAPLYPLLPPSKCMVRSR